MKYKFNEVKYTEGGRALIKIPFNVWEETGISIGLLWNILCTEGCLYQRSLLPIANESNNLQLWSPLTATKYIF